MGNLDYEFIFNDITDELSPVKMIVCKQQAEHEFRVTVDESQLIMLRTCVMPEIVADLIDLALAVHVTDRLSVPKKTQRIKISVTLPVRHPEILGNSHILEQLEETLFWYTGDLWSFQFAQRTVRGRISEDPPYRAFGFHEKAMPTEIALWSGGLDSLAGLYCRLLSSPDTNYTLLGMGSSTIIENTQRSVFRKLVLEERVLHRLRLVQVRIRLDYGKRLHKNSSHRARGFVFLLIGAACAILEKQSSLNVYENGIGAINLPFPANVGRDHTKAVHPKSLVRMSKLVSEVIGKPFEFENPFLFTTKAQMCMPLARNPNLAFETISCDRLHRTKPMQCGYCSSCLLRRQSLAAAGIEDKTHYLIPHGRRFENSHLTYLHYMLKQVEVMDCKLSASNPWHNLTSEYIELPDMVDWMIDTGEEEKKLEEKMLSLYRTYVLEWRDVKSCIKQELMSEREGRPYPKEELKWQQIPLILSIPVN